MDKELSIIKVPQNQRYLELDLNPLSIKIVEIPSVSLGKANRSQIRNARQSYYKLWGNKKTNVLVEDEYDRNIGEDFTATHYIAYINIGISFIKTLTLRKIVFNTDLIEKNMPEDIDFWQTMDPKTLKRKPLWEELKPKLSGMDKIAVISRACAYPESLRSESGRDALAVAFSAAQFMITDGDEDLYICQLCPEVQKKIFSIEDCSGKTVELNFSKTKDIFGFENDLKLDNENPGVYSNKLNFPGYWINNENAVQVLMSLKSDGHIQKTDLLPAFKNFLIEVHGRQHSKLLSGMNYLLDAGFDNRIDFAEKFLELPDDVFFGFITRPAYFKYMVPVMKGNEVIREALIYGAGDGPFSATMMRDDWRKSNVNLLKEAFEKYPPR